MVAVGVRLDDGGRGWRSWRGYWGREGEEDECRTEEMTLQDGVDVAEELDPVALLLCKMILVKLNTPIDAGEALDVPPCKMEGVEMTDGASRYLG